MKVRRFDRSECERVRTAVQEALNNIGAELGLKIDTEGGSYLPHEFRFRVKCKVLGENGSVEYADKAEFDRYAQSFGLKPDDYNKEFTYNGKTYKVCGINSRRRSYPVKVIQKGTNKPYAFPVHIVKTHISGNPTGKRSVEEILEDLRGVESGLSPENLTCDGEASQAHVRQRSAQLHRQRAALVAELGREPTTEELYPPI